MKYLANEFLNHKTNPNYLSDLRKKIFALVGVVWWTEHQPENQKVANWIPSQGTHACVAGQAPPPNRGVREATSLRFSHTSVFLSLSFSLPFLLSKNK